MPRKVNPVPRGLHAVTPALTIRNCSRAIEFYKRALGAEVQTLAPSPDGKGVWHAELRVGNSAVFMNDPVAGMTPEPPSSSAPAAVGFWLYSADCDGAFKRAVGAGAAVKMPPTDMFWGDRIGAVLDPFGYTWTFATRVKEMTEAEMKRAGDEFAKSFGGGS